MNINSTENKYKRWCALAFRTWGVLVDGREGYLSEKKENEELNKRCSMGALEIYKKLYDK